MASLMNRTEQGESGMAVGEMGEKLYEPYRPLRAVQCVWKLLVILNLL